MHKYLQVLYPLDELASLLLHTNLFCFLLTIFGLKSVLSNKSLSTPALLWFPFSWTVFLHPFTLSLLVSSVLKRVSCRLHEVGHCWVFFLSIQPPVSFVGDFTPFTFKVITVKYGLHFAI